MYEYLVRYTKSMTTQTFEALAKSRFSARDFLNKPVDSKILETILQTAAQSPSWSNTRGYMLAIAQGERKQQLIDAYTQKCKAMFRTKDATLSEEERLIAQKMSQPDGDFPVMAPYPQSLKERSARLGLALYKHLNIDRKGMLTLCATSRRSVRQLWDLCLFAAIFCRFLRWMLELCCKRYCWLLKSKA